MGFALLSVFIIPTISIPFVYLVGKKSAKFAAIFVALIALINLALIVTTIPEVLNSSNHRYVETYQWIQILQAKFNLFVDGISVSIAIISLVLIIAAALFSINYMEGKKNLPAYYALLILTFRWSRWRIHNIQSAAVLFLLGTNACSSLLHCGKLGL